MTAPLASLFLPRSQIPPPLLPNPLLASISPKLVTTGSKRVTRLATWNVRSLADCNSSRKQHAFRKYIEAEDPDVLLLTEVSHASPGSDQSLDWLKPRYPYRYWRSGCSVLSKVKPISVRYGCPDVQATTEEDTKAKEDAEHRCIILEFPSTLVVGTYVPNCGAQGKFRPRRERWNELFHRQLECIHEISPGKAVVWAGDFNVIPSRLDLEVPEKNWNLLPGCFSFERSVHAALLEKLGMTDVWRARNRNGREYTHSSVKFGGWRLDGFIVSA